MVKVCHGNCVKSSSSSGLTLYKKASYELTSIHKGNVVPTAAPSICLEVNILQNNGVGCLTTFQHCLHPNDTLSEMRRKLQSWPDFPVCAFIHQRSQAYVNVSVLQWTIWPKYQQSCLLIIHLGDTIYFSKQVVNELCSS